MAHGIINSTEDIGNLFRYIRVTVLGLTQQQFADKLKLSQRYLIEIERGAQNKRTERLFRSLSDLGVKVTFEFDDDEVRDAL